VVSHSVATRRLPVAVMGIAAVVFICACISACGGDRQSLFEIRGELRKGMPREQVEVAIRKHWTANLFRHDGDEINSGQWLRIGSHDSCILNLRFEGDQLVEAQLRDEDSANAPCAGAPGDLK
jgi:hypothetical protein